MVNGAQCVTMVLVELKPMLPADNLDSIQPQGEGPFSL